MYMPSFQRFGKLQFLRIGLGSCEVPEEEIDTLHNFVLDAAVRSVE